MAGQSAICATFIDATPLAVPVLIRNDFDFAIHLGQRTDACAQLPLFQVRDTTGKLIDGPGRCRSPCESFLMGEPVGGCTGNCPMTKVVTLAPGESVSVDWAGLFDVEADLPKACVPERSDGLEFGTKCDHSSAVPSGSFSFSAEAGTLRDCSQNIAGGCHECEPNPEGGCTTPYALIGGSLLTARATVELDARSRNQPVTLIFAD